MFNEEMICCGSKNDFCKKFRSLSLPLKCKATWFHRNRQELAQNQKYTFEGCPNEMRDDICIPGGLLFMWGVVPSFRFRVSVAASQKKTDFGTLKME
jgi:hypothetical protein